MRYLIAGLLALMALGVALLTPDAAERVREHVAERAPSAIPVIVEHDPFRRITTYRSETVDLSAIYATEGGPEVTGVLMQLGAVVDDRRERVPAVGWFVHVPVWRAYEPASSLIAGDIVAPVAPRRIATNDKFVVYDMRIDPMDFLRISEASPAAVSCGDLTIALSDDFLALLRDYARRITP